MPTFKGFNTIDQYKKFSLTDSDLIKRDLLNAFLIKQGQLPGRPGVGTTIWEYIFEPNDSFTVSKIENEVRRIISLDTRIELHELEISSQDNTIRVFLSISLIPTADVEEFYLVFDSEYQTAEIVANNV